MIFVKKGVQFIQKGLIACGVFASQGQVAAQSVKSVAIDFQVLTEIRPVAHEPGTLLYESDPFSLQNKYNTVTVHGLGMDLPEGTSEVTWSVEFLNLGVGRAGLLLYDPPTLGDSHDDFWEKINGEWEIKSTENGSNFAARLAGVPIGKEDDVVVYENAKTSLGKVYLSSKEVADTVVLDGDISELTAIQFEYYAALSPFGDIPKGKVRLYLNDGQSGSTEEVPVDPRGDMVLQTGGLVVYDNERGAKGEIQFTSDEIGDEFTLDGSHRVINEIQFEYFAALNPFETTQKGALRFYANNGMVTGEGGPKKPGDLLFESDTFSLRAGYNMVTVSDLQVRVPEEVDSVTWAFEFTGVTNIGKVGLLVHDEPAKGASANTFWLNTGTKTAPDWQLQNPADGRGNFSARIAAQTAPLVSLTVGSEIYEMGEPISVTFAEGPGNPKDWVGIYRQDMIPGSTAAPAWAYVNGSKKAENGRTGGTLVFDEVLPAGKYVARFLEDDGYDQLASVTFSVAEPPVITASSESYLPDEAITIHFSGGPGNPKDWIAIYRPDMIPSKVPSLLWAFVNGTQTTGEGLVFGSVSFTSGLPAGEYVARYLENDGYSQLTEVSFSVKDSTAPVLTLKGQQSITVDIGEAYEDAGATARDDVDGDITDNIVISGSVNVLEKGTYTIHFNVLDAAGNAAQTVSRTVKVQLVNQTLGLQSGWNLVSFFVESEDMNPATVLASINDQLLQIKNLAQSYIPSMPSFLNTMDNLVVKDGYWVKVKEDVSFELEGVVPAGTAITVSPGWNLVGYPRKSGAAVADELMSLGDTVVLIKNQTQSYDSSLPLFLNTLMTMTPGLGYWLNVTEDGTWKVGNVSDDGLDRNIFKMTSLGGSRWGRVVVHPELGATVLAEVSVGGEPVAEGSLIAAHAGDELRGIGKAVLANGRSYVTLNVSLNGPEQVTFRISDAGTGSEYRVSNAMQIERGKTYGKRQLVNLEGSLPMAGRVQRIGEYELNPFGFSFETVAGRSYVVEFSLDLEKWGKLKNFKGTGKPINFIEPSPSQLPSGKSFYRVKMNQ